MIDLARAWLLWSSWLVLVFAVALVTGAVAWARGERWGDGL